MLKIGICGGHRTGKTTLARDTAQQLDLNFVQTSTSAVFQQHGLDPATPMDFTTRLWIQDKIILAAQEIWQQQQTAFITDRTPIDFMAYTLGDIQGKTEVEFENLENYLNQCFELTNSTFQHLFILQPAIPLVYETGKAALNKAYIEHLNTVVLGLCHDERLHIPVSVIPRQVMDLQQRIDWIKAAL
ncbi:AAA family ATPase [Candidatus Albibeggiatoa sp. nov. NOAA]|uniref:AAA family ATPase n=1 Tax=Candidatus Albibeggiatoa sp. nov. NOAA TaxID=3162724 RepID=UPI0032F6019D|nr:ATP-binding protein [Thiotrichaceae bacterium]